MRLVWLGWYAFSGALWACVTIPDEPRKLAAGGAGGDAGQLSGGSSGSGAAMGGAGGIPIPDSGVCPTGFKPCGEQCVAVSDPSYGCAADGCEPCSQTTRVQSLRCDGSVCAVDVCQPGFGDCNDSLTDGCEHETSSDPQNCGACGWDCSGASCALGLCSAQEIVSGLQGARHILVDETSLYVSQPDTKGVIVTAKDGTAKTGPSVGYANGMAHDASHLYFATSSGVQRWPKAGGAHEQVVDLPDVEELAADDSELWMSRFSDTTTTGEIFRASKTIPGSGASVLTQPARVRAMVTDATRLFFTSWDGKVRRYPKAGGPVDSSLPNTSGPWGIVIDANTIYWRGGDAVRRAAVDGTTETAIFSGQDEPRGLAISNGILFWTTSTAVVQGDPATPQNQRVLSTLKKESRAIAADEAFVYWVTYTAFGDKTGSVFRLRRPPP